MITGGGDNDTLDERNSSDLILGGAGDNPISVRDKYTLTGNGGDNTITVGVGYCSTLGITVA